MPDDMTHRWCTPALLGPWCANAEEALSDALRWGQAVRDPDPGGAIVLRPFAAIEVREPGPRLNGEAGVASCIAGRASRGAQR